MQVKDISKKIIENVAPKFIEHGFKVNKRKREFVREQAGCTQIFDLLFYKNAEGIEIELGVRIKIEHIEDIYHHISNVTAAAKNLYKANNIVFNRGKKGAKGSKAKSVSESFTSFTVAKEAQANTKALNNTVGQLSEDIVKTIVGTTEGSASTVAAEKTIEVIEQ